MSHDIVKDMISVRRGDALHLAMEAASNNVSPRTFEWGFVVLAIESKPAMEAMILRHELSGGIKLQGPRHPREVATEALSGELRAQLAKLEAREIPRYGAKDAIEELHAMAGNGFYSPEALEKAQRAIDALKVGFPLPRTRKAAHGYPMAKSIGQYGMAEEAKRAVQADPSLAMEPAPLGVTLLHRLALQYSWRDDMRLGIVDSARTLLAAGADPSARDALGRTPLHAVAFESEVPAFASLLVQAGADIHARDSDGATPLHRAAERGRGDMVQQLLGLQPDANLADAAGKTALHHAAYSHRVENVAALLA